MQRDPRFEALFNGLNPQQAAKPPGLLQKVGAVIATLIIFGLALTFSVVFFAVVVAVGLGVWGFIWWKTRDLRKAMREHAEAAAQSGRARPGPRPGRPAEGEVLEGEVIREVPDEGTDQGPR